MPPWTIWFSFDRLYSNKCFVVFKQVLWNSSNLNYWSYHYRMVERMIEFLSSSAKLPCELLRWAIWHCLHICDNVVATEMQVRINFLISMKADLRQTPISSCSLSFCIVLVCVGFLEKQISELNSHSLMNLLFLPLLNYFLFNCAPGHLTSQSSLHRRFAWALLPLLSVWVSAIQATVQGLLVPW